MAFLSVKNLSFSYPHSPQANLKDVSFDIQQGDFNLLCGSSGSGKSTLLSLIKHDIAPYGKVEGEIMMEGRKIQDYSGAERSQKIAMVFQHPDDQIVMDTVEAELVFAMENLAFPQDQMRKKVAEIAGYFSLEELFKESVENLSGGQKQILNLASVLILDPDIIILDEPTSQLDPIAANDFISLLRQINKDFGVTILMAEHRLDEVFDLADQVIVLDHGQVIYQEPPRELCEKLTKEDDIYHYLPTASLLYLEFQPYFTKQSCPLNVREARQILADCPCKIVSNASLSKREPSENLVRLHAIDFQYGPKMDLVLDNLSMDIQKGSIHTIMGANASGKTTLLKILAGLLKPQHGKIKFDGAKDLKIAYLPQNPALFFIEETLMDEYRQIVKQHQVEEGDEVIFKALQTFKMTAYKDRHPYDLSGGELQKAALIGCLLSQPDLLLVDEPSKGLDPLAKKDLLSIFKKLQDQGLTIVMVSHDVAFAADLTDQVSLLFKGQISLTTDRDTFFRNNMFYSTQMNRISRKTSCPQTLTFREAVEHWDFIKPSDPTLS